MEIKSMECENCGAHIELIEGLDEGYCPYCGTKYIIINGNNNNYEYEEFKIRKDHEEIIMEELKNFNYEYVSSSTYKVKDHLDKVTLKVRRKQEFKNRNEILKLEHDYHILREEYETYYEQPEPSIKSIIFESFALTCFANFILLIPALIFELTVYIIPIEIGIIIIITTILYLVGMKKYKRVNNAIEEINNKKNDIFNKIKKLNK